MAPYLCIQCNTQFPTIDLLVDHIVDVHAGAGPSNHPEPQGTTKGVFQCRHCRSDFSYRGLRQHLTRSTCAAQHMEWIKKTALTRRARQRSPEGQQDEHVEGGDKTELADDFMGSEGEGSNRGDNEQDIWEGPEQGGHEDEGEDKDKDKDKDEDEDEDEDKDEDEDEDGDGDEDEGSEKSTEKESDSDAESSSEDDGSGDNYIGAVESDQSPPVSPAQAHPPSDPIVQDEIGNGAILEKVVDQHGNTVYIERYPIESAGGPIRRATPEEANRNNNPEVGELANPDFFEIVQVLMESGVSGNFRNKYLRLKRLRGMMPWKNNRELLKAVDKLPHGPDWTVQAIKINGANGEEVVEMWMRNSLSILRQILGNKRLGQFIEYKVIKKWTSPDRTERIRDEFTSADFMWEVQGKIMDEHGTVISIIISSEETKLTNFSGNKKAHPVYMTIGNLPKRLRRRISKRANILLGYLPVPKLDCEPSKTQRAFHRQDLFHKCMRALLAPLSDACREGVEVVCSDGNVRRIYPVLASYIADFPEQCKVACIKNTHCPLCTVKPKKRGNLGNSPLRTRDQVIDAMDEHRNRGGSAAYHQLGLHDVQPFWENYPHVDVGCLFTPDLLHQLHKGVIKDHLTQWVIKLLGKAKVDECHRTMPEYHGMRHFKNGISTVSQWTGRELKEMAKVLLPIMSNCDGPAAVAGRALLDFLYLAHSSALTDGELDDMDRALRTFHENKAYFTAQNVVVTEKGFHGIPKIHMIQHYTHLIRQLGTPDGYNTETSERLHIDFAKMGYRASNKVNATKQMALYIQRMEAIAMHEAYLAGRPQEAQQAEGEPSQGQERIHDELDEEEEELDDWYDEEEADDPDELDDAGVRVELAVQLDEFLRNERDRVGGLWEEVVSVPRPGDQGRPFCYPVPEAVLAKTPTSTGVELAYLEQHHNAINLRSSLRAFLKRENPRTAIHVPEQFRLNIWRRARLVYPPPPFKPSEGPHIDVMRAQPEKIDGFQRVSRPARFDTVMILMHRNKHGVHCYRVGRVRVIFELPPSMQGLYQDKLAYVEMFNEMSREPDEKIGLFTATRSLDDKGARLCSVVPLSDIRMTCHLAPRYRTFHPAEPLILYSDVLQLCETFYFNIFASYFLYELVRHWIQDCRRVERDHQGIAALQNSTCLEAD